MNLGQHFTPAWAAELLVRRHFPDLGPDDTVLDPGAGDGRFLMAVPPEADALGVEIDPKHPMARGKHRVPDDAQPIIWRSL